MESGALSWLDLGGCCNLRSLSPIGTVAAPEGLLKGLTRLNLTGCDRLPAAQIVAAAGGGHNPGLTQLWLSGNSAIEQLALPKTAPVHRTTRAPALQELFLNGLSMLKSLDG